MGGAPYPGVWGPLDIEDGGPIIGGGAMLLLLGGPIIGGGAMLLLLGGPIIVLLFCAVATGGGVGAG